MLYLPVIQKKKSKRFDCTYTLLQIFRDPNLELHLAFHNPLDTSKSLVAPHQAREISYHVAYENLTDALRDFPKTNYFIGFTNSPEESFPQANYPNRFVSLEEVIQDFRTPDSLRHELAESHLICTLQHINRFRKKKKVRDSAGRIVDLMEAVKTRLDLQKLPLEDEVFLSHIKGFQLAHGFCFPPENIKVLYMRYQLYGQELEDFTTKHLPKILEKTPHIKIVREHSLR